MKNTLITFLFFISSTILFSQESKTTIGIQLNPGIATFYAPLFKEVNYARFSTNGGVTIQKNIVKNKLFLESGLFYYDRGYAITMATTDQFGNYTGTYRSVEKEGYLTVPFSIIFKFNKFYFGGGPNVEYYLLRRYIFDGKLISTDKSYQQYPILFGGQLFAGSEFNLSKKLSISFCAFAAPTIMIRSMNYGLGVGLNYRL